MKSLLKLFAFSLCLTSYAICSIAAPQKDLWPRWQANNPASTSVISHDAFKQFLEKYVTTNAAGVNVVNYSAVTASDKTKLRQYLTQLANVLIDNYNRNEQLAYWINLYNALTLDTVLSHYPTKSIRDINLSSGLFSKGPWDAKLIQVEGEALSLNDIEHRILRPIWQDSRIHYAVNCASYSCPNLQKIPYSGRNINAQLTQAAIGYVNDPRGVNIDQGVLTVSQLYDWYQPDFGGSEQAVLQHLMQYAKPALKQQLQNFHKINNYAYNWSLNE